MMMMMITDDDGNFDGGGDWGCRVEEMGERGVAVVAEMWWWRWWRRWWQDVGVEVWKKSQEEVCVCVVKTWEHVCVVKRSRRPFLMKGLRENKQSAASKRLPASARRRHKWPEVLLAKKQTEPKSISCFPHLK
ncbi:hypothetical protein Hanom_Chr08g00691471 [Helianthus anomalus]